MAGTELHHVPVPGAVLSELPKAQIRDLTHERSLPYNPATRFGTGCAPLKSRRLSQAPTVEDSYAANQLTQLLPDGPSH
jgi:hypothetical protein